MSRLLIKRIRFLHSSRTCSRNVETFLSGPRPSFCQLSTASRSPLGLLKSTKPPVLACLQSRFQWFIAFSNSLPGCCISPLQEDVCSFRHKTLLTPTASSSYRVSLWCRMKHSNSPTDWMLLKSHLWRMLFSKSRGLNQSFLGLISSLFRNKMRI